MFDPTAGVGTKGQQVARAPVPAWRSVASVARRVAIVEPYVAKRGSIAISRRADDPTGGPAWALRSWSARISPRLQVSGNGERELVCFAIGTERGDRLVEPRAGGATRTVGMSQRDARCNGPGWLARHAAGSAVRTYVDDPEAPDPKPVRVVISGLLGDGVRSAELLGAGAPRPLELGRHGTFLLVLGPEYAGAVWRVRQVRSNGRAETSPPGEFGIECKPRRGQSMRVADPDGAQPWVVGIGDEIHYAGGLGGMGTSAGCRYVGRAVGDRLGSIFEGDGWLRYGAEGFSGAAKGRPGTPWRRSLTLDVRGPAFDLARGPARPASLAQVARRTLPGRTVVSGRVSNDVTSVTLRTPRDVRTIRPAPGGAFLAVYDGPFYGGEVRAIAHLRGGRVLTRSAPVSPFG